MGGIPTCGGMPLCRRQGARRVLQAVCHQRSVPHAPAAAAAIARDGEAVERIQEPRLDLCIVVWGDEARIQTRLELLCLQERLLDLEVHTSGGNQCRCGVVFLTRCVVAHHVPVETYFVTSLHDPHCQQANQPILLQPTTRVSPMDRAYGTCAAAPANAAEAELRLASASMPQRPTSGLGIADSCASVAAVSERSPTKCIFRFQ